MIPRPWVVDTHAHLTQAAFSDDVESVLVRAYERGVCCVVDVTENAPDAIRLCRLVNSLIAASSGCGYKGSSDNENRASLIGRCDGSRIRVAPCFGVHPIQPAREGAAARDVRCCDMEDVMKMGVLVESAHESLVGIGEVGLDFSPWVLSQRPDAKEVQLTAFRTQIEWALKYNLPLNVHSRFAAKETIECLKSAGVTNALLHGFDGKASEAQMAVQCGFYISMPCTLLRSKQKRNLLPFIPLDKLLLESDSPCMSAEKDVRNEPMNIMNTCQEIAVILKKNPADIASITTNNAMKLFPRAFQPLRPFHIDLYIDLLK